MALSLLLCLLVPLPGACNHDKPHAAEQAPATPPTTPQGVGLRGSFLKTTDLVQRLLADEAAAIQLWDRGLVVDLGSADHLKYVTDGARATWGRFIKDAAGTSRAEVLSGARLKLDDRGGARAVVLHARSVSPCSVELVLNGKSLGAQRLEASWKSLRYALPHPTRQGRQILELQLTYDGRPAAPMEARWLWLTTASTGKLQAAGRLAQVNFGEPMISLLAERPRTYSIRLLVPRGCTLVFDYGARTLTRFEVNLTNTNGVTSSLFAARANHSTWYQAWVDLTEYDGKQVRLELRTVNIRGSDANGAAWGDPLVTCATR